MEMTQEALQEFGKGLLAAVDKKINPEKGGSIDELLQEMMHEEFRYALLYEELTGKAKEIGYQRKRGLEWDHVRTETLVVFLKNLVGTKKVDKARQMLHDHPHLIMPEHFPKLLEYPYPADPRYKVVIDGGARLTVKAKKGKHPYFDAWADHIGLTINEEVAKLKIPGVKDGGDYAKAILANIFQYPYERTPYVYLWGITKGGKSTLPDWILPPLGQNIVTTSSEYLTNHFNFDIVQYVFHSLDEFDASKCHDAANRVKRWSTAPSVSVRPMYLPPFQSRNSFHPWHTGNNIGEAPHFDTDDNRLTAWEVLPVPQENRWTAEEARLAFIDEAPAILWTLLNWKLPEFNTAGGSDRTRIPVIQTNAKREIIERRETPLDIFLGEFYTRQEIDPADKTRWNQNHRYRMDDAGTYTLLTLEAVYTQCAEWLIQKNEKKIGQVQFTNELRERGLIVYRGWNNRTKMIAGLINLDDLLT